MNGMMKTALSQCVIAATLLQVSGASERWSEQKANQWYFENGWMSGCNFNPSSSINQLEFWQADTFDPETIDRELSWAAELGFNSMRVYLHDLVWKEDQEDFKKRIDTFLGIADTHGIKIMFVFFDDCWNTEPKSGLQPEPIPGVHNSGWVQSPGEKIANDPSQWESLELYVKDILKTFGQDDRVVIWDLYNEPGNTGQVDKSIPLLTAVFNWAREVGPSQPLTVAVWNYTPEFETLNTLSLEQSDVITFHYYENLSPMIGVVRGLLKYNRPLLCSEYMARTNNSKFETHLPYFSSANISCYNWGFVGGKSNTIFPWGSEENSPEPDVWFHDILRENGTPFSQEEVDLIKAVNADRQMKKSRSEN